MDLFSSVKNTAERVAKSATSAVNSVVNFSVVTDSVEDSSNVIDGTVQTSSKSLDEANKTSNASFFASSEIPQKAITSAKNLGTFLLGFATKAGSVSCDTVSATAKQIKTSVGDFISKHDFIENIEANKTEAGISPWVGLTDEESQRVKVEILNLSHDKRNFVHAPPKGVQFDFDLHTCFPIALALLNEDENLDKMRYRIVPKVVNEETFWRNYFYRISLIIPESNFSAPKNDHSPSKGKFTMIDKISSENTNKVSQVDESLDEFDKELALNPEEWDNLVGTVDDDEINLELENFNID